MKESWAIKQSAVTASSIRKNYLFFKKSRSNAVSARQSQAIQLFALNLSPSGLAGFRHTRDKSDL